MYINNFAVFYQSVSLLKLNSYIEIHIPITGILLLQNLLFYFCNIYIVAAYCIFLSTKNVHTRGTPALTSTSTILEQSVFSQTHKMTYLPRNGLILKATK